MDDVQISDNEVKESLARLVEALHGVVILVPLPGIAMMALEICRSDLHVDYGTESDADACAGLSERFLAFIADARAERAKDAGQPEPSDPDVSKSHLSSQEND